MRSCSWLLRDKISGRWDLTSRAQPRDYMDFSYGMAVSSSFPFSKIPLIAHCTTFGSRVCAHACSESRTTSRRYTESQTKH